ncbi:MAG: phosphoribosylformylglycinamidine cyclo-ligase, partial [Actinobacteria bacterium]|nr:phosphoribosylformylglycinamidine cyclo-ligase [Actinomycetota bacterium]
MPNDKKKQFTYKDSGVNLDKAGKAIELIKKPVSSTFSKNVLNDLTSYAGLFSFDNKKYRQPVLVSSTDGVGTKLLIAKEANSFAGIGQDLVGMCINDILCCGAMPLFFLDYIACGRLDPQKVKIIVESIAASCSECETALIGGEIAEMPDIYSKDDIDLAGFVVGVVEKASVIKPGLVKENDIIVGLPSSGVHSNGF